MPRPPDSSSRSAPGSRRRVDRLLRRRSRRPGPDGDVAGAENGPRATEVEPKPPGVVAGLALEPPLCRQAEGAALSESRLSQSRRPTRSNGWGVKASRAYTCLMTQTKDWSGLELGRLAMFTMTPAVPNEHFHANIPPIDVFAVSSYPAENSTAFLVLAKQRLAHLPKRTSDGLIVVPDRERRQLEESLEAVANFLAISYRCRRQISSTTPSVVLLPHTDAAREWLADARGFKNDSPSSVMSVVHPHDLVEQHFTQLADRLDVLSTLLRDS